MNKPLVHAFPQKKLETNGLQIITASDELFNHVDENLPMWSGDGEVLWQIFLRTGGH